MKKVINNCVNSRVFLNVYINIADCATKIINKTKTKNKNKICGNTKVDKSKNWGHKRKITMTM